MSSSLPSTITVAVPLLAQPLHRSIERELAASIHGKVDATSFDDGAVISHFDGHYWRDTFYDTNVSAELFSLVASGLACFAIGDLLYTRRRTLYADRGASPSSIGTDFNQPEPSEAQGQDPRCLSETSR